MSMCSIVLCIEYSSATSLQTSWWNLITLTSHSHRRQPLEGTHYIVVLVENNSPTKVTSLDVCVLPQEKRNTSWPGQVRWGILRAAHCTGTEFPLHRNGNKRARLVLTEPVALLRGEMWTELIAFLWSCTCFRRYIHVCMYGFVIIQLRHSLGYS